MKKTEKFNNKKREGDKKRLKEQKRHEKEMEQLTAFANKQQGIISSTSINSNQTMNLDKGIKTINSSSNSSSSKGGWVNSFSAAPVDDNSLNKNINSKGAPGWKNSFTSEENKTDNSNLGNFSDVSSVEPPKSSGVKFSFGMKKADSNDTSSSTHNKPAIGFSIGKKPRTAPIKFKFNK